MTKLTTKLRLDPFAMRGERLPSDAPGRKGPSRAQMVRADVIRRAQKLFGVIAPENHPPCRVLAGGKNYAGVIFWGVPWLGLFRAGYKPARLAGGDPVARWLWFPPWRVKIEALEAERCT